MDPRLRPYFLSKWKCQFHGDYVARTSAPVDPSRPIPCPECRPEFVSQLAGHTVLPVPFVSRPKLPENRGDRTPIFSKNAKLGASKQKRVRGAAWR